MAEPIKAKPPEPPVTWVTLKDGGMAQVTHIVRFVQETGEQCVMIWLSNGNVVSSEDPAFFPVAQQLPAVMEPSDG